VVGLTIVDTDKEYCDRLNEQFEEEAIGFWNFYDHEGCFAVFRIRYLLYRWVDFVRRN